MSLARRTVLQICAFIIKNYVAGVLRASIEAIKVLVSEIGDHGFDAYRCALCERCKGTEIEAS